MDALNSPQTQRAPIQVTLKDLPLSCPLPDQSNWSLHPKVFIPMDGSGNGKCPYCGAEYHLTK